MKKFLLLTLFVLILLACTQKSITKADDPSEKLLAEDDSRPLLNRTFDVSNPEWLKINYTEYKTRFEYKGNVCDINGIFNMEEMDGPFWMLEYSSIDDTEKLIGKALQIGLVYYYDKAKDELIERELTESEKLAIQELIGNEMYRNYTMNSNKAYEKILLLEAFEKNNRGKAIIKLEVNLSTKQVRVF